MRRRLNIYDSFCTEGEGTTGFASDPASPFLLSIHTISTMQRITVPQLKDADYKGCRL